MKVLHIGKYFAPFNGGVENYQRDAMMALAGRGIQSAALVHQHKLSLHSSEEVLQAGGLKLPIVKTATWLKLLFTPISPGFPLRLSRLVNAFKPDLLHLHMPNPSVFWALLLPSARRLPWVVHWHADVVTDRLDWKMKFFYQIYNHFERAVLKRSAAVVATSPPYLASSTPLQAWRDKCVVVPLGATASRLSATGNESAQRTTDNQAQPTETSTSTSTPLQVLAIGRLTYYKGFQYLIRAVALVPGLQVNIVGTGEQLRELETLVATLQLQQRVTFHGALSDQSLAEQMQLCDCVCLPSIERTEAFGMVLLEAQSAGKATVASDVPGSGMGWVVDNHQTGLVVPPADEHALAEAFRYLQSNRTVLLEMGRKGQDKFASEFEINKAIDGLVSVYEKVLTAK